MTSSQPVRKRKSLFWRICYFLLCCIGAACLWYVWPVALVKPQFTISKETTYFTAPVDEEGYVNYQVALNEKISQGVTVDNNAMVLLVKAIGPHPEGPGDLRDEFYQRLGIPRPPSEGNYLIRLTALGKERQWPELSNEDGGNELLKNWYEQVERPWSKEMFPRMAEWLERNREPLLLVDEASKRTRFYSPMVYGTNTKPNQVSLMFALLPYLQWMRELNNMYVARSMYAIHANNYEEAWADLHTVFRLSRLLSQGPTLIEYMVANALQRLAAEAANSLLEKPLSIALLERMHLELQQLPPTSSMADQIHLGERNRALDTLLMINRHGLGFMEQFIGGPFDFPKVNKHAVNRLRNANWDPMLKRINDWYDNLASIAKLKDRNERLQRMQQLNGQLAELKRSTNETNQSWIHYFRSGQKEVDHQGQEWLLLLTPYIEKIFADHDKSTLHFRLMQLAIHLARHQQLHGKYPDKLSELSPSPAKELLINLMNEEPFDYKRTEKGYQLSGPVMLSIEREGEIALAHNQLLFAIPRSPRVPKYLEEIRIHPDTIFMAISFAHAVAVAGEQSSPLLILSMAAAQHLASSDPLGVPR